MNMKPLVTVIVPVRNDAERIGLCIEALLNQNYPADRYEVIVVDNGSTDSTPQVVQSYPVRLLSETSVRSSYAARNTGIRQAKGEVIAFTDSDCVPSRDWIIEGVQSMHAAAADLVGGNVRFFHSGRPTGAGVYDSMTNMQIERNVRDGGVAKTANLFVRATLFDNVGLFPESVQSGGDVTWTGRATAQNAKLVYAPHAEVGHPTRSLKELLRKQYRVGRGQYKIHAAARQPEVAKSNASFLQIAPQIVRGLLPNSVSWVRSSMQQHQIPLSPTMVWRVWFAGWIARIGTSVGLLSMVNFANKVDDNAAS